MKIYSAEPRHKNAVTFLKVPAERFESSDCLAIVISGFKYYI